MVFDDVKSCDEEIFCQYLPSTTQTASSIIFTSRTPAQLNPWANFDVQIQPMVIEEGAMVLSRLLAPEDPYKTELYSSRSYQTTLRSIVSALGGLPVGIIQASAQINYLQISPQEYLDMLSDNSNDLLTIHSSGIYGNQQSLLQTFLPDIYGLSNKELHLISIIAYFEAERVPEKYLTGSCCDCLDCFEFSNCQRWVFIVVAFW